MLNSIYDSNYKIDKSTSVLIYGGGYYGVGYANRMVEAGYNVIGIIDINPDGVKNAPVAVSTPESSFHRFGDAFVWICVSNAIHHKEIAESLVKLGFSKILMLPFFLESSRAKRMVSSYNSFCLGNYEASIPFYDDIWVVRSSDYILEENSGFATVLVPENHLYGLNTNKDTRRSNPFSLNKVTKDNPLTSDDFIPLRLLSDEYKKIFDVNRKDLFSALESALVNFSDYFIRSAGYAQISSSYDYWCILDGYHRSSFLLLKGFKAIPIRVKKDEWEIYFNEGCAQKLMIYCRGLASIPFQIDHPAFLRFPIINSRPDEKFLQLHSELISNR